MLLTCTYPHYEIYRCGIHYTVYLMNLQNVIHFLIYIKPISGCDDIIALS